MSNGNYPDSESLDQLDALLRSARQQLEREPIEDEDEDQNQNGKINDINNRKTKLYTLF